MICFEGKVTEEVRKHIIKEFCKSLVWLSAFLLVLGLIPIILIKSNEANFYFAIMWLLIGVFLAGFCLCVPFIDIKKDFSTKIEIEDGYLTCYFNSNTSLYGKSLYRNLEHVKAVDDFGCYYCIYFSFPHRFIGCMCQKDLLKQGTLEEFEKLFEGKIIRKT